MGHLRVKQSIIEICNDKVDECQALCGDVYSLFEDYYMITVTKSRSNHAPPVTDAIKVVLRIQRYKQSMRAARVHFFISVFLLSGLWLTQLDIPLF